MVFSSLFFVFFFLSAVFLAYFTRKNIKQKNIVLVIASLIFYAWGEPVWVILLIFSSFVNWFAALKIEKNKGKTLAKVIAGAAIGVDILLLVIFKYTGFIVENHNMLFHANVPVPNIVMPIGISFFTFQAISYVLDCLWETVPPQKSWFKFLLYL